MGILEAPWRGCVWVPSPVSQSEEEQPVCYSLRGLHLSFFLIQNIVKQVKVFPQVLNEAIRVVWVKLGFMEVTGIRMLDFFGGKLISFKKLAAFWQLLSSALWYIISFLFIFWTSMYKRNVRGNLYHPGGTVQDVSTSNLFPVATGEIQFVCGSSSCMLSIQKLPSRTMYCP